MNPQACQATNEWDALIMIAGMVLVGFLGWIFVKHV